VWLFEPDQTRAVASLRRRSHWGCQVQVKLDMEDVTISLGNNGIVLMIAGNDGKHVGSLRIGQATVEWRKGRTRAGHGKKMKLTDLVDHLNSLPAS
jgi:hypothetical protein